jgi:hypothetical protein
MARQSADPQEKWDWFGRSPRDPDVTPADAPLDLADLVGSATGEGDDQILPGGWAGTDDDASTAPSDRIGVPAPDRLAELTGGAISDDNPVIEGGRLVGADRTDAIRHAEDRITSGGQRS